MTARLQDRPTYAPVADRPDPLDTLMTPSRDVWTAILIRELEELLEEPGMTTRQRAVEVFRVIEREHGRHIAEER